MNRRSFLGGILAAGASLVGLPKTGQPAKEPASAGNFCHATNRVGLRGPYQAEPIAWMQEQRDFPFPMANMICIMPNTVTDAERKEALRWIDNDGEGPMPECIEQAYRLNKEKRVYERIATSS